MIETYHYAGFSVQTAIAKEQRNRDAADELIRSRKTPRYYGAERTSLWRMPKIEDCLAERSEFELPAPICEQSDQHQVKLCDTEANCKALSPWQRISSALGVAESDRGKLTCPFIGSLLRHQSRCRSSRTKGRSGRSPFECCRPYKLTRRLSLGRSGQFVWAPRTPTSCCSLIEIGTGSSNSPRSARQSQV
jgi:hypothetical protein